jgi:hypothetical protein
MPAMPPQPERDRLLEGEVDQQPAVERPTNDATTIAASGAPARLG